MKQSYLELIGAMSELDPPLFVFGGVAEDALLDRRLSRPHADVDVMVAREELGQRMRQCDALGFRDFEVNYEAIRGSPLALGAQAGELYLELGVCDNDADGYYFAVIDQAGDLCNIRVPDDVFAYPATLIEGTPVHTISPLALYQIREGLGITGSFGPLRPKDLAVQRRLKSAFLADHTEEKLRPGIEKLGPPDVLEELP
jgi:hypothetical protein